MNAFINLFQTLDETTKTTVKVKALIEFFETASDPDKVWAVALLSGKRPKRLVKSKDLRAWCAERSGLPLWLMEESYHIVGDLAETLARLHPPQTHQSDKTLADWMHDITNLSDADIEARKAFVCRAWDGLDEFGRFVFNKVLMGGFRIGVSQRLMTKALAEYADVDASLMALRLMGAWKPTDTNWKSLIAPDDDRADRSRPYPFCLAYALETSPKELGNISDYRIEWKWDGIRAQLIKREGAVYIWSRGEELSTHRFPEIAEAAEGLSIDGVWDGEILVMRDNDIQSFGELQARLGRKTVSKRLRESHPVVFRVYDMLECEGKDMRSAPLHHRISVMEKHIDIRGTIHQEAAAEPESWEDAAALREQSREYKAEGFMIKPLESPYESGRKRGIWWKWKVDPLTVDAVMLYAMRGHGRRANLYTDYTFAVRDGDNLVPVCKAYSGLTDEEIRNVDRFVKSNTIERFGPVRRVVPELVFEIAFEGIRSSTRHKSGLAMRFPRIARWRKEKSVNDINTLDDLHGIIAMLEH